jgi:tetratricopeptide (TPR) repeat protein
MAARNSDTTSTSNRITMLLDELMLAKKWDRPCISFAVYQSEYVREDIQTILEKSLIENGNTILNYTVEKTHCDVALELRDHPGRAQTIFFISGLRWGGGKGRSNAYHALNMHREYLVEEKIKSVFWLSKNEARFLARHAPDFWAFRSNVIEFFDFPSRFENKPEDSGSIDYKQTVESIQAQLDKNPRDLLLQKRIAGVYKYLGFYEDALLHYYRALRITPKKNNIWLDIADVYIDLGRPDSVARITRKVTKMAGNDTETLERLKSLKLAVQSL